MAAVEFHLHQQGCDPGEGDIECQHDKSNSEGEEEIETLVACERHMNGVGTTCAWGGSGWRWGGGYQVGQVVNRKKIPLLSTGEGHVPTAPTQENRHR